MYKEGENSEINANGNPQIMAAIEENSKLITTVSNENFQHFYFIINGMPVC